MKPYYSDASVTIYHADCQDVLPRLAIGTDGDLVLTDPPYGIGVTEMTLGNGRRRLDRGDRKWDVAPDLAPILALNCPTVIWGGNYFSLPPARCWLVWDKGTGDNDYADCELAWTNRDGVVRMFTRSWVGQNAREHEEGGRWHPTQKPLGLMRWCIGLFPGPRTVIDPYMGSGSTLRAAKDLGIPAVGIEAEERYCEIAVKRLQQEVLPFENVG